MKFREIGIVHHDDGRRGIAQVEARGNAGTYEVDELGQGEGRITATVSRGRSARWTTRISDAEALEPQRTARLAVQAVASHVAGVRLAERVAAHPDVCGQDMSLWRDEDVALAEKGLPDHCILEPGHEFGHSVRARS